MLPTLDAGQLVLPFPEPRFAARGLRLRRLVRNMTPEALGLGEAWRYVAENRCGDLAAGTRKRFIAIWANFDLFARAVADVEDPRLVGRPLVDRFIHSRVGSRVPAPATVATRLSAIRFLFDALRAEGLVVHDPTLDLRIDRSAGPKVRMLSDDEVDRCRWVAEVAIDASDRYCATWAVLEAGASTGETGLASWDDVSADLRTISVGQDSSRRAITFTDWGADAMRRARPTTDGQPIAVLRSSTYDSKRTAVAHVIREIFERAGVASAEPRSITAWAAQRTFTATGRIEVVALTIGFESLDRTAELIGFDWRNGDSP
jgi:hypothetical protein